MEFNHYSVLLEETIENLNVRPGGIYVDGTLGGGGHTELILKSSSSIKVLATDRDEEAIEYASARLKKFKNRFEVVHSNFKQIVEILKSKNLKADGVLLDLGVSSHQIDDESRGFSFRFDSSLDMRMDKQYSFTDG